MMLQKSMVQEMEKQWEYVERVDQYTAELKRINKLLQQEIDDHEFMADALRQSSQKFKNLVFNIPCVIYQRAPDSMWTMYFISDEIENLSGYSASDLVRDLSVSYKDIIHEDDRKKVEQAVQEGMRWRKPFVVEYRILHKNGSVRWVMEKGQGVFNMDGSVIWIDGAISDTTEFKMAEEELMKYREHLEVQVKERTEELNRVNEQLQLDIAARKEMEDRQRLAMRILELLNQSGEGTNLIGDILNLIKEFTGSDAAGIRIGEGEDFPYYETRGFPEDFIASERYLCAHDEAGEIIRDSQGTPMYKCMCGDVICGRVDHSLPFITENGSFWTNSTTELLASTNKEDFQTPLRNRCNEFGYESVALIPLRSDSETIGILQLNDKRKNMFTRQMIAFFEGIGSSIGIAIGRKRAEDALRESEGKLKSIFRAAPIGIGLVNNRVLGWTNERLQKMLGYTVDELQGKSARVLYPTNEEYEYVGREKYEQIEKQGTGTVETRLMRRDGKIIDVLLSSTPLDPADLSAGVTFTAMDITERKINEEKIKASLEEKEVMLKEIHHRIKNNMQIISSLLNLQAKKIRYSKYRELFNDSRNRVLSMALVHEKLYKSENLARVDFAKYATDLVKNLLRSYNLMRAKIKFKIEVTGIDLGVDLAIPCALIINELVSNSLKYAFPNGEGGELHISFYKDVMGRYILSVSDNGVGLPSYLDFRKAKTLGLQLVNTLTGQLKGDIKLDNTRGAKFTITFKPKRDT
jgi:PAS domain S-box-containing protein